MPNVKINYNKHKNMLIIGKAATTENLRQISYEYSYSEVLRKYGNSDISKAFKLAKEYGCPDVFVMNLRNNYDYLEATNILSDYDFAYIVPVSVYMSDTLNDPYHNDEEYSIIAYLLSKISKNSSYCDSVIVATDKHASLYEYIDDFIAAMDKSQELIINGSTNRNKLENVITVANNLEDTTYANVVLAASLCFNPLYAYPMANFGKAIFDIDKWDVSKSWAYFKNHVKTSTSIENLLNLKNNGACKIVYVSRILKAIKRELDFGEFIGRHYTEYIRVKIQDKLAAYLESIVGTLIYDFQIQEVYAVKNNSHKGTVSVICLFSVWPLNCLEECKLSKEIII